MKGGKGYVKHYIDAVDGRRPGAVHFGQPVDFKYGAMEEFSCRDDYMNELNVDVLMFLLYLLSKPGKQFYY